MDHYEFLGRVRDALRVAALEDADRAVYATLETLGERITGGEAANLASQLPFETGYYLRKGLSSGESFDVDEFFRRVARREGVDPAIASAHARVVLRVVNDVVSPGLVEHVKAQLPDEFDRLFQPGGVTR